MATNKLVLYFSTFADDEMKSLTKEAKNNLKISDSLHNRRILRLFEYLKKYKEKEDKLTDESIFEYVYENLPYNDKNKRQFSNFKTDVKTFLENHIITKELTEKKSFERDLILTRYLKSRLLQSDNEASPDNQLFKQYYTLLNEQYKNLLNHTQKSIFDYMDMHTISNYLYNSTDTSSWLKPEYDKNDSNETSPHPLKTMVDSLDKFYVLAKLRCANEMTLRKNMLNEKPKIRLAKQARKVADEWRGPRNILFEAYRKLYDLIHYTGEFDINPFREAVSYLKYNHKIISHSELCTLIKMTINAMSIKGYRGRDFQEFKYDMYIFGFENDAFSDEGFLYPQLLINFCYLSIEIGRADQLREFIDTNINKIRVTKDISDKRRKRTHIICEAYMHMGMGNFKEALDLLYENPIEVDSLVIPYRSVRLKSLYEYNQTKDYVDKSGKVVDLVSECNNYELALKHRKDKLSEMFYKQNLNFISFVKEIDRFKIQEGKKKTLEILEKDYLPIAYKGWIEHIINKTN